MAGQVAVDRDAVEMVLDLVDDVVASLAPEEAEALNELFVAVHGRPGPFEPRD